MANFLIFKDNVLINRVVFDPPEESNTYPLGIGESIHEQPMDDSGKYVFVDYGMSYNEIFNI